MRCATSFVSILSFVIAAGVGCSRGDGALGNSTRTATTELTGGAIRGDPLSLQEMMDLRVEGWRLFEKVTTAEPGNPPDWRTWRQKDEVFQATAPNIALSSAPRTHLTLAPPGEVAAVHDEIDPQPIYESTFFNGAAVAHIQNEKLYRPPLPGEPLMNRREVTEFPPNAIIVKSFWRAIRKSGYVGRWKWPGMKTPNDDYPADHRWPQDQQVCVNLDGSSGCLKAEESFYAEKVTEKTLSQYKCVFCPGFSPQKDDLLILIGLHVASKQRPDWLWTTFWWKGLPRTGGDGVKKDWTCDNAQRPTSLNAGQWSYFSMDVTAYFDRPKPVPTDIACGSPYEMPNGDHLLAAYNPFIEARLNRGLRASCIDCHSRAAPGGRHAQFYVPTVGSIDEHPALREFQGRIRTDYLWSIVNAWKHPSQ